MQRPTSGQRDEISISVRTVRRMIVAVALAMILGFVFLVAWQQRDRLTSAFARGPAGAIDPVTHQGVFLVGGQVYFGKLTARDDYLLLDDVFYLSQVDEAPGGAGQGQLIKRGAELHGPREPMIIPVAQVLFIENLKADSEVMSAIARYRAGGPGATAPAAPRPTLATPSPSAPSPRPSPTATR